MAHISNPGREYGRLHDRRHYQKYKERRKANATRHRQKIQARFNAFRSTLKCIRCGEKHPSCLDFHHRDPSAKLASVTTMVHGGFGWDAIEKEIEKCDVVCSNCHRKLHWAEHNVPSEL